MGGFLIPPWYKDEIPQSLEINIVSIIFGFSMGASLFTLSMLIKQTSSAYKRGRYFSAYIAMCWLDWTGCNVTHLSSPLYEELRVSVLYPRRFFNNNYKVHSAVSLSGYFMNDITEVEKLCQRVHFPVEPVTLGQITSLNGIFYILVKEFKMLQVNLGEKYNLDELLSKCQRNFNLGIETYEILVQPTYDNVLALPLAVSRSPRLSKSAC
jgi:hypothetical protein